MNKCCIIYRLKGVVGCALLLCTINTLHAASGSDSTEVSVAYGKQKKLAVTAAISSVDGDDLRKTQTSTLSNTFFGRIPGLSAMQTDGEIGYDEATIYLRGQHTFKDNGFMIMVDGFEVSGFNQITADEIASVAYLKDAAALSIYGMNGGNGVLLITTKRGLRQDKKMDISIKGRFGVQLPQFMPKFKGSYEYASLYNEALANDGLSAFYTPKQLEGYKIGSDPYLYPNVNWYDETLRDAGTIQDYTMTFRGGNKFARYFVMAGFMDSKGLYADTDKKYNTNIGFQKINFRANVDIDITKNLSAQVDLGGRIEDRKFPTTATGTLWKNMATYAPNLYSVRTPGGKYTGTVKYPDNPVGAILGRGWDSRHTYDVQAMVGLTEKLDFITKGLNVFGRIAVNTSYRTGYGKKRTYAYYEPIITDGLDGSIINYEQRGNDTDLSVSTGGDQESSRMNLQLGFDYARSFGLHEISAMTMYHQNTASNLGDQAVFAQQNIVGRINYGYNQKYFAELSVSYNGSENYAKGHRFGVFPALSAGWIISNEDFMKDNGTVSFLKLRASAGLVGNNRGASRFSFNQYWGTASSQGYYFGTGVTYSEALIQLAIQNQNLTWEKSMIYNLGVETGWFDNKLKVDADFFYEDRSDILVDNRNNMPSFSGISFATMVNRGRVRNYGAEVSALYSNSVNDFEYYLGGTFAFARNEITESYESPKKESYRYQQGRPVGQRFGLEAVGFFRDQSDIANSPTQTFTQVRPGDLKYKDQNDDGIIDINDEVAIGRPGCPELNFSLSLGASYKGFDISMLFQGNSNRSVYLNDYMFWPFVNNTNISDWAAEGRWTPQNSANATFPRLTTQPNTNNYRSSDFWVRNVAVLRLRNVELGYTFSSDGLRKAKIQNIRLYASAVNLFTLHNLDVDVDPETLSAGYPTSQTFTFGVNLNF